MSRLLITTQECIKRAHDKYETEFSQKPYYKFYWCVLTLFEQESLFSPEGKRALICQMAKNLVEIRPSKLPAFAFAWVELVTDRLFVTKFLQVPFGKTAGTD